ncbi:hypothetical protein [Bacillus weihaiensis]|nr:hypothetical protein [Bacillus weihaiensis]
MESKYDDIVIINGEPYTREYLESLEKCKEKLIEMDKIFEEMREND